MKYKLKFKNRLVKELFKFMVFTIIYLLIWGSLSFYQHIRYDITNYNCVDMSYDVGKVFETYSIPVKMMYGCHKNESGNITDCHCWLLLWDSIEFEATILMFKKNSDYYSSDIVSVFLPSDNNVNI